MDLLYEIMDQAFVDSRGERCGRVDDIVVEDGFDHPPRVIALLSGNGAKSRHLGKLVHHLSVWLHRILGVPGPIEPIAVPWEQVDRLENDVILKVPAEELGLNELNRAVAERFVGRIPGADR